MPRRSLATLFPHPRRVTLAGRTFLVGELTVGGLAEVRAAAEAGRPDPLESVRDLLGAAHVPASERHRIDRALAMAEGDDDGWEPGPEQWGAEDLSLVRVALRAHHPGVAEDAGALLALAEAATDAELDAVRAAAIRPDPMAVLCRALDRFCGTGGDGGDEPLDWPELVDRLAKGWGVTYAAIREMTLTQFANALSGGKPGGEREARPGEDAAATHRAWTRWLAGEDEGRSEREGAG
jgi:hypothetical protein